MPIVVIGRRFSIPLRRVSIVDEVTDSSVIGEAGNLMHSLK